MAISSSEIQTTVYRRRGKQEVPTFQDLLAVVNDVQTCVTAINADFGGSVTSVALSLPAIFTVSGSPVTTSGTLTGTLATQVANTIFSGPATGADAAPTFRSLVAADIPAISLTTGVSGVLPIANGGTALSTLGTAGQQLRVNAGATGLEYFTDISSTGFVDGGNSFGANATIGLNDDYSLTFVIDGVHSGVISNSTGAVWNTTFGYSSGSSFTSGTQNTFIGHEAGQLVSSGSNNTILGYSAGGTMTSGSDNIMLGAAAGSGATLLSNVVLIGVGSGNAIASTSNTIFVGSLTGQTWSGSDNTAIGHNAGYNVTGGDQNVVIGSNSLINTSSASISNNVIIGEATGASVSAALSGSVLIGRGADVTAGFTNCVAIGNAATVGVSNGFVLGGASTLVGIRTSSPTEALTIGGGNLSMASTTAVQSIIASSTASMGLKIGTSASQLLGFWNATPVAQSTGWTMSNVTTDKVLNANSTTLDEVADVLGTLVDQLKTYGILGA
jgi:hypothetical protein